MTQVRKLWPLLTAVQHYDKSISTYRVGRGQLIEAPILAYLLETAHGRILYDVGCDHQKINQTPLRDHYFNPQQFPDGPPQMHEEQRVPRHLARLGLTPADVDVIFIGHLHWDHAGGLKELRRCGCGAEIHLQQDEWRYRHEDANVSKRTGAHIWPNHDMAFYRLLHAFPRAYE